MRALYLHISGLVSLLVFLKEVLNYAPLERTILVAATTGLTVYLMLIVGHTIVQQIMAYSPPTPPSQSKQAAPQASDSPAAPADTASARSAPAHSESASNTSASPTRSSSTTEEEAENDTETTSEPPAATDDSSESAPDRAPSVDRQEAEPSEPVAQTPA